MKIFKTMAALATSVKSPCNYVESTEVVNGQTLTVVSDPVLGFDYDYCSSVAYMLSITLPARQACLGNYAGSVIEPVDANVQGLPINYVGKCNKTGESVACSRSFNALSLGKVIGFIAAVLVRVQEQDADLTKGSRKKAA